MAHNERKHVFISHHHRDDAQVDKLTRLIGGKGIDIRNSSIRAKPANQARLDKGLVSDNAIKRLLRRKISWATTVVVLIGSETHTRPWVNWEIDQANAQGKRIIGVFEQDGKNADIPPSLEKYGSTIVDWNPARIIDAINGKGENVFQNPDGSARSPTNLGVTSQC